MRCSGNLPGMDPDPPFVYPLSPQQLRAEAEKYDRLVHRHARWRAIGPAPEDSEPWPLTTRSAQQLTVDDKITLVELFKTQAHMYWELAEEIDNE
jgi:hypothetical protein